ncbi:hypothetical protein DFH06DRAFT_1425436 [Mycena polygramma]|nr:hypothetical protein DFH06DRAFT_1425436 [Mycena polygramma]
MASPSPLWTVTSPLLTVSLDVLQHIFSWASPSDLQNVRLVCQFLHAYIDDPLHTSIWRTAFRNLSFDVPCPTTLTTFRYSGLATLLFGGGKCLTCRRFTNSVPYSFALRIRFCSMACEFDALLRIPPTPKKAPALPNTLPVPLPYLEGSSELRLYEPSKVNGAWRTFESACRQTPDVIRMPLVTPACQSSDPRLDQWMATAEVLCDGARQYRIAKELVDAENEQEDLQVFTPLVWKSVRDVVLSELSERIVTLGSHLPCPFCPAKPRGQPRRFSDEGLERHIANCKSTRAVSPMPQDQDDDTLYNARRSKTFRIISLGYQAGFAGFAGGYFARFMERGVTPMCCNSIMAEGRSKRRREWKESPSLDAHMSYMEPSSSWYRMWSTPIVTTGNIDSVEFVVQSFCIRGQSDQDVVQRRRLFAASSPRVADTWFYACLNRPRTLRKDRPIREVDPFPSPHTSAYSIARQHGTIDIRYSPAYSAQETRDQPDCSWVAEASSGFKFCSTLARALQNGQWWFVGGSCSRAVESPDLGRQPENYGWQFPQTE